MTRETLQFLRWLTTQVSVSGNDPEFIVKAMQLHNAQQQLDMELRKPEQEVSMNGGEPLTFEDAS